MLRVIAQRGGVSYHWLLTGDGDRDSVLENKETSLGHIYDYMKENGYARDVVMQAISSYQANPYSNIWNRFEKILTEEEDDE